MSDTIAAISTAQGEGGISVIRISGDSAFSVCDKIFKGINNKKLADMKGYYQNNLLHHVLINQMYNQLNHNYYLNL